MSNKLLLNYTRMSIERVYGTQMRTRCVPDAYHMRIICISYEYNIRIKCVEYVYLMSIEYIQCVHMRIITL
jgi:hypothetical protein